MTISLLLLSLKGMLQMDVGHIFTALHPFVDSRNIRWLPRPGEEWRLIAQDIVKGSGPGSWFEQSILPKEESDSSLSGSIGSKCRAI